MDPTDMMEAKMKKALDRVNQVLEVTRAHPQLCGKVDHVHRDLYSAVEASSQALVASQVIALSALGLTPEPLRQLIDWSKTSTVTLRFVAEERTSFLREESHDEEDPTKRVTEGGVFGTVTSKIVRKITEYFWKFSFTYRIEAFRGVGREPSDFLEIRSRSGDMELVSRSKTCPTGAEIKAPAATFTHDVSWLLRHLVAADGPFLPSFTIDRSDEACRTPRRNPQILAAHDAAAELCGWTSNVEAYIERDLSTKYDLGRARERPKVQSKPDLDLVFEPIFPVLYPEPQDRFTAGPAAPGGFPVLVTEEQLGNEAPAEEAADASGALVPGTAQQQPSLALTAGDMNLFLDEQQRGLAKVNEQLQAAYATIPTGAPCSIHEAQLCMVLQHLQRLCARYMESVQYVEELLRKQLIAAIGKEVTPVEFAEYVKFHNSKLFAPEYRPRPFCYAVRRSPSHSPEGTLSILEKLTSDMPQPMDTVVAAGVGDQPMQFPISAAVNVTFRGDRFVHASMQHSFTGSQTRSLSLVAKARQFSSMIVMVGRIGSATTFEPKYAAIVQNQDELTIPLKLSTIPTSKEFKDAISSLSPEQQSFAKAFRSMQLASTLFGILVIQIKPQLERVLCVPENSLTKEIQLTQHLMELFIEYQIPSDLLAFDPTNGGDLQPLAAVKQHVAALHAMIHAEKQKEIAEQKMKAQYQDPFVEAPMLDEEESMDFLATTSRRTSSARKKGSLMNSLSFGSAPPPLPAPPGAASAPMKKSKGKSRRARASPQSVQPGRGPGRPAHPGQASSSTLQQPLERTFSDPLEETPGRGGGVGAADGGTVDYTLLPDALEAKMEAIDRDSPLRPTIIDVDDVWTKKAKAALLAPLTTSTLDGDRQKTEKDAAFDLLDALSKSGGLELDHASLHVVIAATHCFDKTILDTVIQDNINPVDKVERSTLIMASTIHGREPRALVEPSHIQRLSAASPTLFLTSEPAGGSAEEKAE